MPSFVHFYFVKNSYTMDSGLSCQKPFQLLLRIKDLVICEIAYPFTKKCNAMPGLSYSNKKDAIPLYRSPMIGLSGGTLF